MDTTALQQKVQRQQQDIENIVQHVDETQEIITQLIAAYIQMIDSGRPIDPQRLLALLSMCNDALQANVKYLQSVGNEVKLLCDLVVKLNAIIQRD